MKCSCGSTKEYNNCCELFISGEESPSTPLELMRSRYTAFCVKNMDYIEDTIDPQAFDLFNLEANKEWADKATFTKLEVLNSNSEGNKGDVEFIAHYDIDGESFTHHEKAKFRKQAGIWYFRDSKIIENKK